MFDINNPLKTRYKSSISLAHLWGFDKTFLEAYAQVHDIVICGPDRCYILWQFAQTFNNRPDLIRMVEVGVAKGGTAKLLSLASPKAVLYLFDTFEGMPPNEEGLPAKIYAGSKQEIHSLLPNARLIKGLFERHISLEFDVWLDTRYKEPKLDLIHVDCDLIAPLIHSLNEIWPRLEVCVAMRCGDNR